MPPTPEPNRSASPVPSLPETALTTPPAPQPPTDAGTVDSPAPEVVTPPDSSPTDGIPAQIGGYCIEGEIARGGMGIVLRAHDERFGRSLAVKLLQEKYRGNAEVAQRFLEEAQVMGQLQHPGIPPVYDLGELPDGRPFFALKLIKGRTLAELLHERPHPAHDLARWVALFGQVCQTVAYAHSRGILHRDLKPSNIMVGAFGEVQVMDWGLAKVLGRPATGEVSSPPEDMSTIATVRTAEDDLATQEGAVLGTPAYMAPEQARGEVEQVDERCDVFGLGAMLCQILTGQPPYLGPNVTAVLRQASNAELDDACSRLDRCGADRELITLAKRCLEARLERRVRAAGEVAAAMTSYLQSVQHKLRQAEVEKAAAEARAEEEHKRRQVERQRRRTTMALATLAVLFAVTAALAGVWYVQDQAERETEQARLQAQKTRVEQEVQAALANESDERNKQQKQLADPQQVHLLLNEIDKWGSALERREQFLKLADKLVASNAELLTADLKERVSTQQVQWQADNNDYTVAKKLDESRLLATRIKGGRFTYTAAVEGYAGVFSDLRLDVAQGEPAEMAAQCKRFPVPLVLAAALDHWAELTLFAKDKTGPKLVANLMAIAKRVDPDPWRDQVRDTIAGQDEKKLQELKKLGSQLKHQSPQVILLLALSLPDKKGTVELLRQALVHHPRDYWLHFRLGTLVQDPGEKIGCYRAVLAIRPKSPPAYLNLGAALNAKGDLDEAITCYEKALELDADYGFAYYHLGAALREKKELDRAIECFNKALKYGAELHYVYNGLGWALLDKHDVAGAIANFHKALKLDDKFGLAYHGLGLALQTKGDLDGAIASYRKAVTYAPKNAYAHDDLGLGLQAQGNFVEALGYFQKSVALGNNAAKDHLKKCVLLLDLGRKLPAILANQAQPKDAAEQLALADLCLTYKQLYAAAAKLYAGAFDANPKLAEDLTKPNRYDAACAAVMAAAGLGKDATPLDANNKTQLRQQALDWLRADLALWQQQATSKAPAALDALSRSLAHWQTDSDLASIRDPMGLARLPDAERQEWQQLWAEVSKLLSAAKK
jgi:serine/threonine-protein kinase